MTIRTIVSRGAVAVGGTLLFAIIAQTHLSSQTTTTGSAREHDDLMASCSAEFNGLAQATSASARQRHLATWDKQYGVGKFFWSMQSASLQKQLAFMRAEAPEQDPDLKAWDALHACTITGRIAQLDGATPVSGRYVATLPADEQIAGAPLAAQPAKRTPPAVGSAAARPAPPTPGVKAAPDSGRSSPGEPARPERVAADTRPAGHNPENEATQCVELIPRNEFAAKGVKSTMGAMLRNTCPYAIDVTWCIVGGDCKPGYSNLWKIGANKDWPISAPTDRHFDAKWAACKSENGFQNSQSALSPEFRHACK